MSETSLISCFRCSGKYSHPGPCPNCCPYNAFNIDTAWQIGVKAHAMQFRKGRSKKGRNGPPYAVHIAEILSLLWQWGFDVDCHGEIYQVACLHDAVEEKGITFDEIAHTPGLGSVLSRRIRQMTFEDGDKDAYLKTFTDSALTDVECLIVKIADRVCNVRNFQITDLDLMLNHHYARKYLQKGEPIFAALLSRREEIIERSGRGTVHIDRGRTIYRRMIDTVDELHSQLECSY